MENNNVIKEVKHDDNCFFGYLGALVGGIIGALPWILIWYYGGNNIMPLIMLIPVCEFFGYKFFKGTVNKKTFKVIAIISVIIYICSRAFMYEYNYEKNKLKRYTNFELEESRISDEIVGEVVMLILGDAIAYYEIYRLLQRYKSTNGTIKDSSLFVRKDNDPIDQSGDFGVIKFTKDENSIIKENGKDTVISDNFDDNLNINNNNFKSQVLDGSFFNNENTNSQTSQTKNIYTKTYTTVYKTSKDSNGKVVKREKEVKEDKEASKAVVTIFIIAIIFILIIASEAISFFADLISELSM